MKTLALLGGMTFEATAVYYDIINRHVRSVKGGNASAPLFLYSANQREMLQYIVPGQWDNVAAVYIKAAKAMVAGGAEAIVICALLAHNVAEEIGRSVDVPLLHIADFVGEAVKAEELDCVALLGTKIAMEADYFKGRIKQKFGIEVIVPEIEQDRDRVNGGIINELTKGNVSAETKAMFISVARNLLSRGAKGLILGSTDLGFVIKPHDLAVPMFNTAQIHALGVARYIVEE